MRLSTVVSSGFFKLLIRRLRFPQKSDGRRGGKFWHAAASTWTWSLKFKLHESSLLIKAAHMKWISPGENCPAGPGLSVTLSIPSVILVPFDTLCMSIHWYIWRESSRLSPAAHLVYKKIWYSWEKGIISNYEKYKKYEDRLGTIEDNIDLFLQRERQ